MKKSIILLLILPLAAISCGQKEVSIKVAEGSLLIEPLREDAIRVRLLPEEQNDVPALEELIFTEKAPKVKFKVKKKGDDVSVVTKKMSAYYSSRTGALVFKDASGKVILEEKAGGAELVPTQVQGVPAYSVSRTFLSPEDEHIYGTGQFQDGFLDIKGLPRRLTQVNSQISLPFIVSNKGYGLLWHNYGLTELNPCDNCLSLSLEREGVSVDKVNVTGTSGNLMEIRKYNSFSGEITVDVDGVYSLLLDVGNKMARKHYLAIDGKPVIDFSNFWLPPTAATKVRLSAGSHSLEVRGASSDKPVIYWEKTKDETTFRSPVAQGLDYTAFVGDADQVMHAFRSLSGHVPPMPDWIFKYIHCRERYASQDQLLEASDRFAREGIPVGTIVQDWQWWGKYGWNAMQFDEDTYPDPAGMVRKVHENGQHVMLSVWSKVDERSEVGSQMKDQGYFIEGSNWVDFFKSDAAAFYWKNFSERLLPTGIDAWWQDATEPENDDLVGRHVGDDGIPGEFYRNVYPMKVIETVYEGLRRDDPDRLPVILTRSSFTGIQRYGAMTWSGDIGADWTSFKAQIAAGLGQMAAGLPWWAYDAGGFFRPVEQYTDADYQERMIRWIQTAVYLPFMRVHGYVSRTEPWEYFPETERLFKDAIQRREALMPYILECSRRVSEEDYTMMRPLVFDFPDDQEALRQDCEYMFGPDFLICPVTCSGASSWKVYLPVNEGGWEDTRNGDHLEGGRYHEVPLDMENIPVFKIIRNE